MSYNKQCEQFDNLLSIVSNGAITITFPNKVEPDFMLESILGHCDDYYSVFVQFDEDEFQQQTVFFDEWFQVYSPCNDSEPYFNVLINGNTMRIEPF